MITIIVDNQYEYNKMKTFAINYVCKNVPFNECGKYACGSCKKCYRDHHVECGIRVIPPVDNDITDEL